MSGGDLGVPETVELERAARLAGSVRPPGDKSISHRALLLGALARGRSTVVGLSDGDDVARTVGCVRALGASVEVDGDRVEVDGGDLAPSGAALDCGNSGTTMRLLCGAVAGTRGSHVLDGDASLRSRPMDRVAAPLGRMGVAIVGNGTSCTAPLQVTTTGAVRAIRYELPVPSAQVKSAILLAGLFGDGPTTVVEPVATRAHTEDMLARSGARIEVAARPDGRHTTLWPSELAPRDWSVPADPSQGAFFVVAGVLCDDGDVVVRDLELAEERTGFLAVLARMGAGLEVHRATAGAGSGSAGDVVARSSALHGTDVASSELPSLDEVPVLTVAAAAATGVTRFFDAAELRVKETDRLAACVHLARALGASARVEGDTLVVEGRGSAAGFRPFDLDARGDHRMAMAAAVAATAGAGGRVSGFGGVATSYPGFLAALASLR